MEAGTDKELAAKRGRGFLGRPFDGLGRFLLLLVLVFGCASVGLTMQRAVGLSYWWYYLIVAGMGAVLYVASGVLTGWYIRRRAPEFDSNEEIVPGVQTWELTAGLGIVPKWVSLIGIVAIGFFLAIPFELVALAVQTFG